jgi:16S rRNA C1402 (ribose-2'-O) methylase RsmI
MTKIHEEFLRGTASELAASIGSRMLRGEATVLVEGRR